MYKNNCQFLAFFLLLLAFASCNLEKEIEVTLPPYKEQKIVECYLVPGQPFRALLTKSTSYFDPFVFDNITTILGKILEDSAKVEIRFGNQSILLENQISFDATSQKVFNYSSDKLVPNDFTSEFDLIITLKNGQIINGKTKIATTVAIDSVKIEFNTKGEARALTYVTDDPSTKDYYRRMLHLNSLVDSTSEQDFLADDQILQGSTRLVFGSGYVFSKNDTIFNTLIHINQDYFDFISSVKNAVANNGNPFGQPGIIVSNIKGSADVLGIFTGFSVSRDTSYVK